MRRSNSNNELCKTNLAKVNSFFVKLKKKEIIPEDDFDYLRITVNELLVNESKSLKECSEKLVVEYYLSELFKRFKDNNIDFKDEFFWNDIKYTVRNKLAAKYTGHKTFDNNIDIYFNAVKAEYIKHPYNESENLEFIPENYDIFIKNNLKLVIECAKRYQNLGLSFEDLIQAGNVGLLTALEKYDKNKANLRVKILKLLHESELEKFTKFDAEELIKSGFTYAKNLDMTLNKVPEHGFNSKREFEKWVCEHIKVASFASVAFMWIRAEIIIELNQVGSIIHVPQSAQKNGTGIASIINLDSINPYTDDAYHDNKISQVANEEFIVEDANMEYSERNATFKDVVTDVLYKLDDVERRVIMKKFGIDFPYQLSITEIAENEMLSTNKVKYLLKNGLKKIANSINPRDREMIIQMLS